MTRQLCTFFVEDLRMGIEVSRIQEILRRQEITEVPLAPAEIAGLLNLRGQIVMVVDLHVKLDLSRTVPPNPAFLILRGEEGPTCFRVDKVGEVVDVEDESREPVPPQLRGGISECATGVYSREDGLIVEMAAEKLLGETLIEKINA